MSEQKEAVEKPAAKKQSSHQSSGSSGAFLAMLIALGAGGGSYYVWQQHLVAERDRQSLEQRIEQLLQVVEEKDRAQQSRIEQLADHRHGEVDQRLKQLEQTLPDLSQQLNVQQQEWQLAEADYLLRLASHRLELNRDTATAITALKQAREQLALYTSGQYAEVISAIDENIRLLNSLAPSTANEVSDQLGELLAGLDALPFAVQAEHQPEAPSMPAAPADDAKLAEKTKYWLNVMWQDIKSLVTIRRSDEINLPVMNPEQRYLVQTQLRLKLETARLAAMGHNQALYQHSLQEAERWITRYFDTTSHETSRTAETIQRLSALDIAPELPSLQPLRQLLQSQQPLPEPVVESPPAELPPAEPMPTVPGNNPWGAPMFEAPGNGAAQ